MVDEYARFFCGTSPCGNDSPLRGRPGHCISHGCCPVCRKLDRTNTCWILGHIGASVPRSWLYGEDRHRSLLQKVLTTQGTSEKDSTAAWEALRLICDRSERVVVTEVGAIDGERHHFQPGTYVEAHSLNKAELNGKRGRVQGMQDARVQVIFDNA